MRGLVEGRSRRRQAGRQGRTEIGPPIAKALQRFLSQRATATWLACAAVEVRGLGEIGHSPARAASGRSKRDSASFDVGARVEVRFGERQEHGDAWMVFVESAKSTAPGPSFPGRHGVHRPALESWPVRRPAWRPRRRRGPDGGHLHVPGGVGLPRSGASTVRLRSRLNEEDVDAGWRVAIVMRCGGGMAVSFELASHRSNASSNGRPSPAAGIYNAADQHVCWAIAQSVSASLIRLPSRALC